MDIRRRVFGDSGNSAPSGAVDKLAATVGSICISNGTDIWFISLSNWQSYTGTEYQAIGVTVAAVGDCGDPYVRVCSIPFMDCSNPDAGGLSYYQKIYWNGYNANIGGGITETQSANIAKADYNGKKNTTAILAVATGQPNWRTDSTISNVGMQSYNVYFPAACCCWRFHTLGTNQGDWYLPACGELYKGWQNRSVIEPSLQVLGMTDAYGNIHVSYWSSTSYSAFGAWLVYWNDDMVYNNARHSDRVVRAFAAF